MLLSRYCTNAQGLATSFQHRCPCSSVASVSVCWAKEDVPFALFCSMRATSDPYYSGNASGTDSYGQVQQHIGFVAEVLILVSCLAMHAPQSTVQGQTGSEDDVSCSTRFSLLHRLFLRGKSCWCITLHRCSCHLRYFNLVSSVPSMPENCAHDIGCHSFFPVWFF